MNDIYVRAAKKSSHLTCEVDVSKFWVGSKSAESKFAESKFSMCMSSAWHKSVYLEGTLWTCFGDNDL